MPETTPKVRFFTGPSSASVAYAVHGNGSALVVPAWWVSHVELDWSDAAFRQFFLALGEHHTVVRYDRPGVGLSDRQRNSFTLADEVATLAAMIDYLELPSCALLGVSCGGPVAIEYAHTQPERVTKLILAGSFVNGADIANTEIQEAFCSLVSAYWGLGAKAIIDLFDPDMLSGQRKELGKLHRDSATSEMALALLKLTFAMDARETASQLQTPALVLHRAKDSTVAFDAGRRLASTLRNAQLVSIAGKAHLPWVGEETKEFVQEILQFTGVLDTAHSQQSTNATHNQFKKTSDVWTLSFAGKTAHLKDSLGLQDLATLLAHKGEEIHVNELTTGREATVIQQEAPVLDEQAIRHYRQRLHEIADEKQEAAQIGDDQDYQRLENEQDVISRTLNEGLGLGGRQRMLNSETEKARKSISARIRSSIKRIEAVHPPLGEHLADCVRTGTFCSYNSPEPVEWLT